MGKIRSNIRSSPKLSARLRSSIDQVNGQIDTLCNSNGNSIPPVDPPEKKRVQILSENRPVDSLQELTFDGYSDDPMNSPIVPLPTEQRPMTAPNIPHHQNRSHSTNTSQSPPSATKKPFLKKRTRRMRPKKVDWSHVKPKTVSRLSQNVRASRNTGNNRNRNKPNVINWKKRATSRVDCSWSSDKYRPCNVPPDPKKRDLREKRPKSSESTQSAHGHSRSRPSVNSSASKKHNQFVDSYHNISNGSNHSNGQHPKPTKHSKKRSKTIQMTDDEYLFYLKKGNKIGKIPRDAATAQLQDGSGDMIICPHSSRSASCQSRSTRSFEVEEASSGHMGVISSNTGMDSDYERYLQEDSSSEIHTENQLRELQQTFAAIEKAMKQRRQQQLR